MDTTLQEQITALQEQVQALQGAMPEEKIWWIAALIIMGLAYIQNISFSIVSRSRNRNNMKYHLIASVFSNGIWFLTFRELVRADMTFTLFIPYTIATVAGSLTGAKVSMWIEKMLGASADGHLEKEKPVATKATVPAPPQTVKATPQKSRPVRVRKKN